MIRKASWPFGPGELKRKRRKTFVSPELFRAKRTKERKRKYQEFKNKIIGSAWMHTGFKGIMRGDLWWHPSLNNKIKVYGALEVHVSLNHQRILLTHLCSLYVWCLWLLNAVCIYSVCGYKMLSVVVRCSLYIVSVVVRCSLYMASVVVSFSLYMVSVVVRYSLYIWCMW